MTKVTYDRAQSKIEQVKTGIDASKSYRQVALRQLCKHMKVPADTWRGLSIQEQSIVKSLAANLVAYSKLTPKQWGLAKRVLSSHKR